MKLRIQAASAQQADSLLICRLVSVELRSSALDMTRAPSGPKPFPAKQSASASTRNYTPTYIIAATFIAARVDSRPIFRLVSVELRSSALDTARAPSGPILLPASTFVTRSKAQTVACLTARHAAEHHLTIKVQLSYAGVELQHARDSAPSFLAEIIACNTKARHDRASRQHNATHDHHHPSPPSSRNL